jgi:hypothetical protein
MKDIRCPTKGYTSEPGSVGTMWNFTLVQLQLVAYILYLQLFLRHLQKSLTLGRLGGSYTC